MTMNTIAHKGGKSNADWVNREDIYKTFQFMFDDENELREVFVTFKSGRVVGAFKRDEADKLIAALNRYQEKWEAAYIGLNPTTKETLKRGTLSAGYRSNDGDIQRYARLLIDFDRTKVYKDQGNATEDELAKCYEVAVKCREDLLKRGITTALACSGNGYHLLVKTDMGKDERWRLFRNDHPRLLHRL